MLSLIPLVRCWCRFTSEPWLHTLGWGLGHIGFKASGSTWVPKHLVWENSVPLSGANVQHLARSITNQINAYDVGLEFRNEGSTVYIGSLPSNSSQPSRD